MSSASDATAFEDASLADDASAVSPTRPSPLALDASLASSSTTPFTPLAAVTPGKPSFKPKLALQLVPEDTTSSDSSTTTTTTTTTTPSSPPSPSTAAAASHHGRGGVSDRVAVAGRTTNTTFREDRFEIRHASFTSASRRQSTNTQPSSSTSSAAASPATSTPSTPPQHLLPLSSTTLTTLSILGRGASATVLKCRHTPTSRLIALKCIDVSTTHNRHQLVKELREYDSAAYASPYFVEWYGAYYESGQVRIGLEYMDRGGLDGVVKRYGGLRDERLIANIMRQALLALQQLHASHKIHRDIKPANFLLHSSGAVKCADFGLLAQLESTLSQRQTFTGTVLYMSPERLASEEYGVSADVWSLGMAALVLDSGKHPLEAVMRDGGYFAVMAEVTRGMRDGSAGEEEKKEDGGEKENGGAEAEEASNGVTGLMRRWEDDLSDGRTEHMRDFIRCCLHPNPQQRHTASQLLTHPFITAAPDNTAALPLWPPDMRMGEVEAEEAAVAVAADEVGVGEWQRRASGKEWIRQSMIGNARKERDRRKGAGSVAGVAAVVSPPDDLSSLKTSDSGAP